VRAPHHSLLDVARFTSGNTGVRDGACVRTRSARGISKNMQKYEKLEKIGEGELFAVRVDDKRRPATRNCYTC